MRAEESLAKLALDELVSMYSDALPYAIVPNGNGAGAGAPYGNNPSGSPLGPATRGAERIAISNWNSYLSNAFGNGINPAFDQNINALYPFSFTFGNGVQPSSSICSGSGASRSLTGTVTNVGDNYFMMETGQGQNRRVNVGSCSQLSSNQPNYDMVPGSQVIVRGL